MRLTMHACIFNSTIATVEHDLICSGIVTLYVDKDSYHQGQYNQVLYAASQHMHT